jgi:hypothetical protein
MSSKGEGGGILREELDYLADNCRRGTAGAVLDDGSNPASSLWAHVSSNSTRFSLGCAISVPCCSSPGWREEKCNRHCWNTSTFPRMHHEMPAITCHHTCLTEYRPPPPLVALTEICQAPVQLHEVLEWSAGRGVLEGDRPVFLCVFVYGGGGRERWREMERDGERGCGRMEGV